MKGDGHAAIECQTLAVGYAGDFCAQARGKQRRGWGGTQISARIGTRMISMRMRDERTIDRRPRIDVEPTAGTAQTFRCRLEQLGHAPIMERVRPGTQS